MVMSLASGWLSVVPLSCRACYTRHECEVNEIIGDCLMRLQRYFIVLAVCLCGIGRINGDEAEDRAVAAIEKLGGKYTRDETKPTKPIVTVSIGNTKITDEGLKELAPLTSLEMLSISCTGVTDVGLKELASFKNLKTLYVGSVKITDAGLKEIAALKSLEALYIGNTKITDAGLKKLVELKQLKTLNVCKTKITDDGVKVLREALPKCEIER